MDAKKLSIIFLVAIIIIAGLMFGLKSCQKLPESKNTETSDEKETVKTPQVDYKNAFIMANTDFTCAIIADSELQKSSEKMETLLNDSYKKYGFPINDNATMISLLKQYENLPEVIAAIQENVKACKK